MRCCWHCTRVWSRPRLEIRLRYDRRCTSTSRPSTTTRTSIHADLQELMRSGSLIDTTVGRVILNQHLPEEIPFINGLLKKSGSAGVGGLLLHQARQRSDCPKMLDEIKESQLPLRHHGGCLVRHRRHGHSEEEDLDHRPGSQRCGCTSRSNAPVGSSPPASVTTRSSTSGTG